MPAKDKPGKAEPPSVAGMPAKPVAPRCREHEYQHQYGRSLGGSDATVPPGQKPGPAPKKKA